MRSLNNSMPECEVMTGIGRSRVFAAHADGRLLEAPGDLVLLEVWWWLEAAELALDKPGKRDRSAVFQIAAGDLHADRQAIALRDRHRRRRQAGQDCDARPYALVVVRDLRSIDLEIARVLRRRMIMRECLGGHWRAQYDVDILEQCLPARPQPAADAALA